MTKTANRRQVLQALGLAAGSLWLPSLSREAVAADLPPQRVIFFFTQHGTFYDGWKMHGARDAAAKWSYDLNGLSSGEFSEALRPLHPWRGKLGVFDGLALVSAEADKSGLRHELAQVHALTGANIKLVSGVPLASAPSIDQLIADHIARPDRHRTMELAVGDPPISINYRGDRELMPMERSPEVLFRRLFGLTEATSQGSGVLRSQGSVLDAVMARYDRLSKRLSREDRQRLETHRELVREMEVRVTGLTQVSCSSLPDEPTGDGDYLTTFQNFAKLITSAFSCDLTRVATFHMGQLSGRRVDPTFAGDIHDEMAHAIYESAEAGRMMTQYTKVHAEEFAHLLSLLDGIPEAGGTMLDNTTVVWCGEIADGAHGFEHWPVVMAGGRGWRQARYHHWPSDTPFSGWAWNRTLPSMGVPHQKFLTSLANSFGLPLDSMPVREIIGNQGARIDCTGVLSGVLI